MHLKYRPDIDGLRALAVLSVIVFHLNSHWLHDGFVGVDVFFVISGFLITKIIYSDIINQKFSFKEFYQHRINRILPVFFVVMFCTAFAAWYLLLVDEFSNASEYGVVIAMMIALSLLSYYFIEKPCRKHKKSFKFSFILYYLIPTLIIFGGYHFYHKTSFLKTAQIKNNKFVFNDSNRWILGQNDFLFLGNAYDNTIEKLTLSKKPSSKALNQFIDLMNELVNSAQKNHTQVAMIIGSNKSSIYGEFLPKILKENRNARMRYLDFYLARLRKIKNLVVYDSTKDLLESKQENEFLYYRTDTHWNNKGAFIAYEHFMKSMHLPVPEVKLALIKSYFGDLIEIGELKDFPLHDDDSFAAAIKGYEFVTCHSISEARDAFGGEVICNNRHPLVDQKIWVTGDSFSNALKPYLNATFKEVVYLGHWASRLQNLNTDYLEAKDKPNIILIIRVERSF